MRLWHNNIIPFLPDMQLKGQWRECVLIAKDLQEKGETNHLLINILKDYTHSEFMTYCWYVYQEMHNRGFAVTLSAQQKVFYRDWKLWCFRERKLFEHWHNKEYLRVCYANLYEKYKFGRGKSRITEAEWQELIRGYRVITGEEYKI